MTKRSWIAAFVAAFFVSIVGAGIGEAVGEEGSPQVEGAVMTTLARIF